MSKGTLFLLTLLGILTPAVSIFLAAESGIHPYLMIAVTAFSVILLTVNGSRSVLCGRRQGWGLLPMILLTALNLIPALFYAALLFPMWMASMMYF